MYPKLNVYFNFDGFLVSTLTSGFTPVTNLLDAVAQVSSMNLIRYIALFYLNFWRYVTYQFQNKTLGDRITIEKKVFPNRSLSNVDRRPKDSGVPDDVSKKSSWLNKHKTNKQDSVPSRDTNEWNYWMRFKFTLYVLPP